MGNTIIIFARLPRLNHVKSRLAAVLGARHALELYCAALTHTLHEAAKSGARCVIYHANVHDGEALRQWLKGINLEFEMKPQCEDPNLGNRMQHALSAELQIADEVLLIGSDIPDLDSAILTSAIAAMSKFDIVLGPANDGGFYCIGVTSAAKSNLSFLESIPWSTSSVYQQTAESARRCNLSVVAPDTLPILRDWDTAQDVKDWLLTAEPTPMRELASTAIDNIRDH